MAAPAACGEEVKKIPTDAQWAADWSPQGNLSKRNAVTNLPNTDPIWKETVMNAEPIA